MAMQMNDLQKLLEDNLPGATVRIDDLRGDGEHYAAHIIYDQFVGKNRVQQHQMVYTALQGKMADDLHALQIHTSTPQQ